MRNLRERTHHTGEFHKALQSQIKWVFCFCRKFLNRCAPFFLAIMKTFVVSFRLFQRLYRRTGVYPHRYIKAHTIGLSYTVGGGADTMICSFHSSSRLTRVVMFITALMGSVQSSLGSFFPLLYTQQPCQIWDQLSSRARWRLLFHPWTILCCCTWNSLVSSSQAILWSSQSLFSSL